MLSISDPVTWRCILSNLLGFCHKKQSLGKLTNDPIRKEFINLPTKANALKKVRSIKAKGYNLTIKAIYIGKERIPY